MTAREFAAFRKKMKKSQRDMARLLGLSIKAIHSYEQGWRQIPGSAERQLLFLYSMHRDTRTRRKICWSIRHCPPEEKHRCPAWEFRCGHLCWFVSGTRCQGAGPRSWKEKIRLCRACEVFRPLFEGALEALGDDGPQVQAETDKNRQPDQE